ncbi:phosphotransferase [uncultured Agrococcus sp.]|uniref:phosphotransferase n=1 Tax=uncultured Agrococcus sp. TaxID=382258 RepID=UPI0025F048E1|nr:phosphotransferase [uncultured Agrococcus sp.]
MEILNQAAALRRKRRWDAAIELLTGESAAAVTGTEAWFVELAKTYRVASRRQDARALLERARKEIETPSIRVAEEEYYFHAFARDYENALNSSERLTRIDPSYAKGHFLKGKTLVRLTRFQQAREAFITGLRVAHDAPLEEVIERVESGLLATLGSRFRCESEYVVGRGGNNLGILMHRVGSRQYITKIAQSPGPIDVGGNFYRNIVPRIPELRDVTPAYINSQRIEGIYYLTMEYVEGNASIADDDAVELAKRLARIGYAELQGVQGLSKPALLLVNRPTSLARFFGRLHRKSGTRALFKQLSGVLRANEYPASMQRTTVELSKLVQRSRVFTLIDPERHYCLAHNDFRSGNLIGVNLETPAKMIDCESVRIGQRFADLASYFGCQQRPFEHFDSCFQRHESMRSVSVAERVYLDLAFLYYSVLHAGAEGVAEIEETVVAPAVSSIRRGVDDIRAARRVLERQDAEASPSVTEETKSGG